MRRDIKAVIMHASHTGNDRMEIETTMMAPAGVGSPTNISFVP